MSRFGCIGASTAFVAAVTAYGCSSEDRPPALATGTVEMPHSDAGGDGGTGGTAGAGTGGAAGSGATGGGGAAGIGGSGGAVGSSAWTETSTVNAPTKRRSHQAVWTGNEMIVFGGTPFGTEGALLGGRYFPDTDAWSPLPTASAPCFRSSDGYVYASSGAWTGSELIVWCGTGADRGGGRYSPSADAWTPISESGAPEAAPVVWSGTELLVCCDYLGNGGRYDPSADAWNTMATAPSGVGGSGATAVWTGTAMIVWGGEAGSAWTNAGASYDPATNTWTPIQQQGSPSPRSLHTAIWTGSGMIVWGGWDGDSSNRLADGGSYDPLTDSWTPVAAETGLSGRDRHTAVWTGAEMIIWGGSHGPPYPTDKGRYNPATSTWSLILDQDDYRYEHTAVWAGNQMIVWGGVAVAETDVFDTGGRYKP